MRGRKYERKGSENRRAAFVCIMTRGIYQNSCGDAATRLPHRVARRSLLEIKRTSARRAPGRGGTGERRTGKGEIEMCQVPDRTRESFPRESTWCGRVERNRGGEETRGDSLLISGNRQENGAREAMPRAAPPDV